MDQNPIQIIQKILSLIMLLITKNKLNYLFNLKQEHISQAATSLCIQPCFETPLQGIITWESTGNWKNYSRMNEKSMIIEFFQFFKQRITATELNKQNFTDVLWLVTQTEVFNG